jgi:hypothetical protein
MHQRKEVLAQRAAKTKIVPVRHRRSLSIPEPRSTPKDGRLIVAQQALLSDPLSQENSQRFVEEKRKSHETGGGSS